MWSSVQNIGPIYRTQAQYEMSTVTKGVRGDGRLLPQGNSWSSSTNSPSADLTGSSEHDMVDEPELVVKDKQDKHVKSDT